MLDLPNALSLIFVGDQALMAIIRLSLVVTLSATVLAGAIGLPVGAIVALTRFRGRDATIVALNGLMGLPPVVVGLLVYLALSRSGPLGSLGLLFTPLAMIIAQAILITPIIAALTRQVVDDLWAEYRDEFTAMQVSPITRVQALLWDARFSLVTIMLAVITSSWFISKVPLLSQSTLGLGLVVYGASVIATVTAICVIIRVGRVGTSGTGV